MRYAQLPDAFGQISAGIPKILISSPPSPTPSTMLAPSESGIAASFVPPEYDPERDPPVLTSPSAPTVCPEVLCRPRFGASQSPGVGS